MLITFYSVAFFCLHTHKVIRDVDVPLFHCIKISLTIRSLPVSYASVKATKSTHADTCRHACVCVHAQTHTHKQN